MPEALGCCKTLKNKEANGICGDNETGSEKQGQQYSWWAVKKRKFINGKDECIVRNCPKSQKWQHDQVVERFCAIS